MNPKKLTGFLVIFTLIAASSVEAAPSEKSQKDGKVKKADGVKSHDGHSHHDGQGPGGLTFSVQERRVIEQEFEVYKKGKKGKSLPPGLQKKLDRGGKLPPGWEKKLNRGEVIPVEVYRETHPVPREIIARLPTPPHGTVLVTIHGKILRVLEKTREIVDVFDILP